LLFESCKKLQNITLSKLNYFNFSEWYFADSYLPSFYMLAQLNRVVSMFTFVVYMKARPDPHASHEKKAPFSPQLLLRNAGLRAKIQAFLQKQVIFPQDGPAATLFYIREGRVRLTLLSSEGKAATITILGKGEFLGEECLVPRHNLRLASAVAVNDCSLLEIGKNRMLAALDTDHALASSFMQSLLMRKIHAEDNLAGCFIPVRNVWSACFSCWQARGRTAEPNATSLKSARRSWPRWSAQPGRASVTS
jgi:CRP-like cAMP-binding protein